MKHLALLVSLLLSVGAIAAQTTTAALTDIEAEEHPGGEFSGAALYQLMVGLANDLEQDWNGDRITAYGRACDNWWLNLRTNGQCVPAPAPPNRLDVRVVKTAFGWGLDPVEAAEPLGEVCAVPLEEVPKIGKSCRETLQLPLPPPPESGKIHVGECWYDGRCRAWPDDTVAAGERVSGDYFPDAKARYKHSKPTPWGVVSWYDLAGVQ